MKKIKYRIIKFNRPAGRTCDKLLIQGVGDKQTVIDIKQGQDFYGVVLNGKDIKKLIKFLETI